jgi:hypothetical protein
MKHGGAFLDPHPAEAGGPSMLWSDPLTLLALRGEEADVKTFELIGIEIARRLTKDRAIEAARSLLQHKIPPANVAAALCRARFLGKAGQALARNPFLFLKMLSQVVTSELDIEVPVSADLLEAVDFANQVMGQSGGGQFDLVSELSLEGKQDVSSDQ